MSAEPELDRRLPQRRAALPAVVDHVADDRVDMTVPALAAEDAVMAGSRLNIVRPHVLPQVLAQIMCGERLPERADVVAFAFDRQQGAAADRARIDRPA